MLAAACGRSPAEPPARAKPNILLITIDTFRADRLGAGVAPTLDRLATSSLQFTSARTAVPLTLPSHTTILTGQLPPEHGVRDNGVDPSGNPADTMARLLNAAGYQTAAFVGAYVLDRRFGLSQGFDTYDDQIPRDPNATERLEAERPASAVVDRALAWLDRRSASPQPPAPNPQSLIPNPFFLWIHLYDPHAPYNPPPEFVRSTAGRTATVEERYDGEVRYADAQIARVLAWLDAHALRDRTLVVVAGDHGEGLGDHGERTHGMLLYDSTLRVPLIVSMPGSAAARRDDPVSLADIAPTVLRAAGIAVPAAMKGRDLLGGMGRMGGTGRNGGVAASAELYIETEYPRVAGWSPLHALTDGRWMAITGARSHGAVRPAKRSDAKSGTSRPRSRRSPRRWPRASTPSGGAPPSRRAARYRPTPRSGCVRWATSPARASRRLETVDRIRPRRSMRGISSRTRSRRSIRVRSQRPRPPCRSWPPPILIRRSFKPPTHARSGKAASRRARSRSTDGAAQRWPTDALLLHDLAVAARDAATKMSGPAASALIDEAVRADRAALVLSPNSAIAHNGLGLLAVDLNRPQDALKEFERAATIDPNNASYSTNLGNARRAVGDASGAEQAYRRALEVDPRAGTPSTASVSCWWRPNVRRRRSRCSSAPSRPRPISRKRD